MHAAYVRCVHDESARGSWPRRPVLLLFIAPLLACGLWLATTRAAQANTITVDADCSLIDAINSANHDTNEADCEFGVGDDIVLLEINAIYTLTETYSVVNGVNHTGLPPITSTILIRGRGSTIQRDPSFACPGGSDPDFRIFYVNETGDLTLSSVTVRNGCAPDGGGVYVITGTLTIQSSDIVSNTTTSGDGGGIYVESGTAHVQSGDVLSNTASDDGGGIYGDEGATLAIEGSAIVSNTSISGGGVHIRDGALTLLNSQLVFNSALQSGGGISSNDSTVVISTTTVAANTAENINGGGVAIAGGTVTLLDSEVLSNTAKSNGGGIFHTNSATLSIQNSKVTSNTATNGNGGGIWQGGGTLTLRNSHVYSNTASNGGGIYGGSVVTITQESRVAANQADEDGGGIHVLNGTLTVQNSNIITNIAGEDGGGIYSTGSSTVVTISDSGLLYNQVESGTGAALYQDDGQSTLKDSCIVGNEDTAVFFFGGVSPITASQNWWGSVDGPSGAEPGHGDSVSADVDVTPFLTAAILDCPTFIWDMALGKNVDPTGALQAGQHLTYTLHFSNTGNRIAESVVLTDRIPAGLEVTEVTSSTLGIGVVITQTQGAPDFVWQVGDLLPGSGGMITVAAVVSAGLSVDLTLTNTAVISAAFDLTPTNDVAQVVQPVTLPRVHFATATYGEDEDGAAATITVTLDAANPHAGVAVEYQTTDGSATASSDYTAVTETLFIPAGSTSATFPVAIHDDSTVEADETVTLTLRNASGAVVDLPDEAGLTISDNDSATVSLAAVNLDQNEGNSGSQDFVLAATLDNAVDGGFDLTYTTEDGSATTADSDYVDNDDTLHFAGTEAEVQTIAITVNSDTKVEADETFTVSLGAVSGLSAGINASDISTGGSPQTGIIRNDDSATLSLAIVNADRNESNSDSRDFTFAVTLDNAVQGGLDVAYTTDDGSATTADNDYADNDSTVNFSGTPGEVETITVQVQGDTRVEPDESFAVALGAVGGLSAGVSAADISTTGSPQSGTIRNDDMAILTLAAGMADANEGDSGTTEFTFTVTLDSEVVGGLDVAYTTDDGTATTADGDYINNDGSLSFDGTAGEAQTIIVLGQGDTQVEPDESFAVALGAVSGLPAGISAADIATSGSPQNGIIRNDDGAILTLATLNGDQNEGDSGGTDFTFLVTINQAIAGGFSVAYTTDDGTATTANNDYVDNDGSLSFNGMANEAKTFTVTVNGDTTVEADETFTVTVDALNDLPAGLEAADIAIAGSPQTAIIRNDDSEPELTAAITVAVTADVALARVGETIVYTYLVTNSGEITLTVVQVVDDRLGSIALSTATLPPAATASGTASQTVQVGDLPGPLQNRALTTGTPGADPPVQAEGAVSVSLVQAGFIFSKTVGIQDIEPVCTTNTEETLPLQTVVVYCYEITNTGQVTLTSHSLVDNQLGELLQSAAIDVAPGASYSTTITHTLLVSVTNIATWTANYAGAPASGNVSGAAKKALPVQAAGSAVVRVSGPGADQDGDGIPDNVEGGDNRDNDNLPNFRDLDSDDDGVFDSIEAGADPSLPLDSNDDGTPDFLDPDRQGGEEEPDEFKTFLPWLRGAGPVRSAAVDDVSAEEMLR